MDAVEVWNGPWSGINARNERAVQRWHQLLERRRLHSRPSATPTPTTRPVVGRPQTVVRAGSLSVPELLAGYRGGHAWIAESAAVGLDFEAGLGEATAGCGDRLGSGASDAVAVRLHVTGLDDGCVATLLGPGSGAPLATAPASGGEATIETTMAGSAAFVRAEVRRGTAATAPMVAMTNPILLAGPGAPAAR